MTRKHRRMREHARTVRSAQGDSGAQSDQTPRFLHERARRWLVWARGERGDVSSDVVRDMVEAGELKDYGKDAREAAQELAYEALENDDRRAAHQLALRAIATDNSCADARRIVAERESRSEIDRVGWLKRTLVDEEARLGAELLSEFAGRLSEVVEALPFLRTQLDLACALWTLGRHERARTHFRALLDHDEHDYLGVRYPLAMAHLHLGEHAAARDLLFRGERDEAELLIRWARVLERVLAGEVDEADAEYAEIAATHDAVASSLAPAPPADFPHVPYHRDELSEFASVCLRMLHFAWHAHEESRAWLARHAGGPEVG